MDQVKEMIREWEEGTYKAEKEAAESALEAKQIAREKEDTRLNG